MRNMHGEIANVPGSSSRVYPWGLMLCAEWQLSLQCFDLTEQNSHFKLEISTQIALKFQVNIVKLIGEIVYTL